ncbi:MAG: hypothetical protein GY948_01170 [Alphaproteobacteria bacterium]|nr:hypothetical protein [Alphaproteobacteria bacterium]
MLLKKAIDQRAEGDAICIPSDTSSPVDRLTSAQHVGKQFHRSVSDDAEVNLAWASVWKHSIYRSVFHHIYNDILKRIDGHSSENTEGYMREYEKTQIALSQSLAEKYLKISLGPAKGPYYYFVEICNKLDAGRHQYLSKVREEVQELEELLQLARPSIFVFLDNLDDYYEKQPELWFNSMYGQFRAVREIGLAHRHIHVFTTIRQDVYQQFADEMRLQYYDYVSFLRYSSEELAQIFEARVKDLDDDLLAEPKQRSKNPWKAFFGAAEMIENRVIGVKEHVRDYTARHTLHRPRDLVHMGTVLLDQRCPDGFTDEVVKTSVKNASIDVAKQYLAEIRPLLDPRFDVSHFIKKHVTSNVLDLIDIERITAAYVDEFDDPKIKEEPSDLTRPFETLIDIGLIGYAEQRSNSDEYCQHFNPPGQGLVEPEGRFLPDSCMFFLHPILTNFLKPGSICTDYLVGKGQPIPEGGSL